MTLARLAQDEEPGRASGEDGDRRHRVGVRWYEDWEVHGAAGREHYTAGGLKSLPLGGYRPECRN